MTRPLLLSPGDDLCAWSGCTIICCRFHMYPGQAGLYLFITVQSYDAQVIEYIMARWSNSLIRILHYLIIIIMQKVLNFTLNTQFIECVSKMNSIISVVSCDYWENTRTLSIIIIKSEVWPICHWFHLGPDWNNGMHCMSIHWYKSSSNLVRCTMELYSLVHGR